MIASVDHGDVLARVRDDAGWSARFALMTVLSAGIAVLGLLQSSPAVVIGAMLISPLMGPIIGLGFGLATFDARAIRHSLIAMALGIVLAVLFCAAVVLVSPLQNVTSEITARTRPNLFDLMIALFSALAGAYATIRGRAGTVVGVAIATALMPPLAVVGFGLATLNRSVFLGAALLFFTNFMTIALTAAVTARAYRFGPRLSPHQTVLQTVVLIALFVTLAVPLGLTLRRVAAEAVTSRQARDAVTAQFDPGARVAQVELNYDTDPLRLTGTVFTAHFKPGADRAVAAELGRLLGRPVDAVLEQIHVEAGAADAQAGQTNSDAQAAANRVADDVAARAALIAGVPRDHVLVDRSAKRVAVHAAVLPGADFASYRVLESRVAAASPGWRILLTPPALPLAQTIAPNDGTITPAGTMVIADAAWASQRLGLPVAVSGPANRAAAVRRALLAAGADVVDGTIGGATVRLRWQLPPAVTKP